MNHFKQIFGNMREKKGGNYKEEKAELKYMEKINSKNVKSGRKGREKKRNQQMIPIIFFLNFY